MRAVSNLTTTDAPLWDSSENHGPLVSVVTWFLIITAFLAVLARVATRFAVVRRVKLDDASIIVALTLGIGQSVATSLQASNGLGRHLASVSPDSLTRFERSTYASGLLYIGALTMVKVSICVHLNHLTPIARQRQLIHCVGIFSGLWMLSSVFVLLFQCQLPHPWSLFKGKSINIVGFWTYLHIINILTDLALTVLPWMILSNLQIKKSDKAIIIGCFVARSIVIATTILQLHFLLTRASLTDPTFTFWLPTLLTSIVQALSLITACIPFLKPFMSALETGMMRGQQTTPPAAFSHAGNHSTRDYLKHSGDMRMSHMGFARVGGVKGPTTMTSTKKPHSTRPDSDTESQTSQSKIIRKTVGWSVTEEEAQVSPPTNTHLEHPPHGDFGRAI